MNSSNLTNQFIMVGSRKIRYVKSGKGKNLVLIHGLGGSLEWWDLLVPELSKTFCVYAIDFPGFGLSDPLNEKMTSTFATSFINSLLDAFGIEKTCLIGHSMGGYIALKTALSSTKRIEKLVLVSSAGFGNVQNPILRFLSIPIIGDIVAIPSKLGIKMFIDSLFFDKRNISKERVSTAYQYFKRPHAKQSFLAILRSRNDAINIQERLFLQNNKCNLEIPILLLWGKQDTLFPVSQSKLAEKQLVNSRLRVFDKCGHLPQIEHDKEFLNILLDFLLH